MKGQKKYTIALVALTAALLIFALVAYLLHAQWFTVAIPLLTLYFCAVTAVQHWLVVGGMQRSPRTFVQVFLGTIVGVLLLHIVVMVTCMLTLHTNVRTFLIAFCIGYVVYLVFETIALVKYVNRQQKAMQKQ